MLVEIVVVTVVVVTVMTTLYVLFNRVYNAFELKSSYSDVNSIYALNVIRDYFIETEVKQDGKSVGFLYNLLINHVEKGDGYGYIEIKENMFDDGDEFGLKLDDIDKFNKYMKNVFKEYKISKIYMIADYAAKADLEEKKPIDVLFEKDDINLTFKEYIEYLYDSNFIYSERLDEYCSYSTIMVIETYSGVEEDVSNKYAYLTINTRCSV